MVNTVLVHLVFVFNHKCILVAKYISLCEFLDTGRKITFVIVKRCKDAFRPFSLGVKCLDFTLFAFFEILAKKKRTAAKRTKKNSGKTSAGRFLRHKHKQTFALENENCDAM